MRLGLRIGFQAEQFVKDRDEAPTDVEIANAIVDQGNRALCPVEEAGAQLLFKGRHAAHLTAAGVRPSPVASALLPCSATATKTSIVISIRLRMAVCPRLMFDP